MTVDQFSKHVQTVQRRAWHPRGSDPTLEVSGSRHKVTLLGAVSDDRESLYVWTEETLTARHGVQLLQAIQAEFGPKVVVVLDRAPYFYAKAVWASVSGEEATECVEGTSVERVVGSGLRVWYLPPHLPELNPVEGCWKELQAWFNHRLVEGLAELKELLRPALEAISEPDICRHLCP